MARSLTVINQQEEATPSALLHKTVILIDVLRATSTLTTMLASGAAEAWCYPTVREVFRARRKIKDKDILLCGERNGFPVRGFDLGNSPKLFTPERCRGRVFLMSTTNGTRALRLAHDAAEIIAGSFLNLSAIVKHVSTTKRDLVILCAGTEGHFSADDVACAGAIAERLVELGVSAGSGVKEAIRVWRRARQSLKKFLLASAGGKPLIAAGLESDIIDCARRDRYNIVPIVTERSNGYRMAGIRP